MASLIVRLHRPILILARVSALVGGVVLCLLALMTVASIIGREDSDLFGVPVLGPAIEALNLSPVKGDFEIVSAGTAFAVLLFFPLTQLVRGHASVSLLTDLMPKLFNRFLDLIIDLALLAIAALLTWRHTVGMLEKIDNAQTTFILRFPVWWGYAAALAGLIIWLIIALWCSANSARLLFESNDLPDLRQDGEGLS